MVYEPDAILQEDALSDQTSEYKMRVRVSLRAIWALYDKRGLFNLFKYPVYGWQLFSHKLLRYMAWLALIGALISNMLLATEGAIYSVIMLLHAVFYGLALYGFLNRTSAEIPKIASIPYYFILINFAAMHAFLQFLQGKKQVIWNPRTG